MATKTRAPVSKMSLEEEIQSLQAYATEYSNQFTMLSEQLKYIDAAKTEARSTIETLETLKTIDTKTTVLLPLGGGVMVRASVESAKTVLVTIGAGITLEKSADDSISYLTDRITEMESSGKRLTESITKLQEQMRAVDVRMQQIYSTIQNQKEQQ